MIIDKLNSFPLIRPFVALLFSRKFLVAVVTFGVMTLVAYEPRLERIAPLLIIALTALAGVIIHGIAKEDAANVAWEYAAYAAEAPLTKLESVDELRVDVKNAANQAIDELKTEINK